MKLNTLFKKSPLIVLLSLGLAGSPLVANADGGNRARHGDYKAGHRGEYRDHGNRSGYRQGYRDGYSDQNYRRRHYRPQYASYRSYGHGRPYGHTSFTFAMYSDDLDIIFRD